MSLWLNGIGVSRGVAIGRAQRLHGTDLEIPERSLQEGDIEREVSRFYDAQRQARDELKAVRAQIPPGTLGDIAAFIDTHLLMMMTAPSSMPPSTLSAAPNSMPKRH